jgi:hypothetical protein
MYRTLPCYHLWACVLQRAERGDNVYNKFPSSVYYCARKIYCWNNAAQ